MTLISRDAAIKALDDNLIVIGENNAVAVRNYIRGVYNRLCDLPSAQPDPLTDKEEAVEYIKNAQEYLRDIGETWCADYLSDSIELLVGGEEKRMIPIKIERREPVMKWIPVSEAMPEEDTISRQLAIEAIKRAIWDKQTAKDGIDALCNIPSAQPERKRGKWIPVSEAMPEESDGTVLVCMPNKFPYNEKEPFVNAKHNRQVETATYSQHSDTWHYTNGGVKSTRPIAWMPLPEPYQKEGD